MSAASGGEPRVTTVEVVCSGASQPGCGRTYRTYPSPWIGEPRIVSHGVCGPCAEVEAAAFLAEEQVRRGFVGCSDCDEPVESLEPGDIEPLCKRCREADLEAEPTLILAPAPPPAAPPEVEETGAKGDVYRFGYGPGEIGPSAIEQVVGGDDREGLGAAAAAVLMAIATLILGGLILLAGGILQ